jgi:predicted DNA-binding transcriptional regulator AlpA
METDTLLRLPEAAEYLSVSTAHLYRLRAEDRGPRSHKRNGKVYYQKADLDAYVALTMVQSTRGGIR